MHLSRRHRSVNLRVISPLKALNYLIHQLESDIVTIDYRVRGFTRDVNGMKHFIDHEINSIQNFMSEDMKSLYDMVDVNVYQENIFHTKMLLKEFDLKHYMFHTKPEDLTETERRRSPPRCGKRCARFTTAAIFLRSDSPLAAPDGAVTPAAPALAQKRALSVQPALTAAD